MAENQELVGGRYRILGRLGKGAMGVVYMAHDPVLDRKVGIKQMSAEIAQNEDLRQRFYVEARAAARLNHPHIITIHELQEVDGEIYMVMELLEGKPLSSFIEEKPGPLPLETTLDVMAQVCDGLEYAHQHAIIHRDIKPANLFVCSAGVVKILDFGIARLGNIHLTATGALVGTPDYMSPEQVRGDEIDRRTDVWSAGAVLYQLLSGAKPFEGRPLAKLLMAITQTPHIPLQQRAPALPKAVCDLVDRMLAKPRDGRPATAGLVRDELRAILGRESVVKPRIEVAEEYGETLVILPGTQPGSASTIAASSAGTTAASSAGTTAASSAGTMPPSSATRANVSVPAAPAAAPPIPPLPRLDVAPPPPAAPVAPPAAAPIQPAAPAVVAAAPSAAAELRPPVPPPPVAPPSQPPSLQPVATETAAAPRTPPPPAPSRVAVPASAPAPAVPGGGAARGKRTGLVIAMVALVALVALAGGAVAVWWFVGPRLLEMTGLSKPAPTTTTATASGKTGTEQPGGTGSGTPSAPPASSAAVDPANAALPVEQPASGDATSSSSTPTAPAATPGSSPAPSTTTPPATPSSPFFPAAVAEARKPAETQGRTASSPSPAAAREGQRQASAGEVSDRRPLAGAGAPVATPAKAPRATQPAEEGPPLEKPRVTDQLTQDTVATLSGRRSGQSGYGNTQAGSAVAAVNRITWVLEQYAGAMQRRDADAVREYRPSPNGTETQLLGARSVSLKLEVIDVQVDGTSATARCRRALEATLASGAPLRQQGTVTFTLTRRPAGWVITDVR